MLHLVAVSHSEIVQPATVASLHCECPPQVKVRRCVLINGGGWQMEERKLRISFFFLFLGHPLNL